MLDWAYQDNLVRRSAIGQGSSLCVGGCSMEVLVPHLFFECPNFGGLWYHVYNWLGIVVTL